MTNAQESTPWSPRVLAETLRNLIAKAEPPGVLGGPVLLNRDLARKILALLESIS